MDEIVRGKQAPSREFVVDSTSVKKLRSRLGLSQPKFAALLHVDWAHFGIESKVDVISKDPTHVLTALAGAGA